MSLNEEFTELLLKAIKNNPNDILFLYDYLVKFKNKGMDKNSMLENLEKLRSKSDSQTEDTLLDLMDYIVGFCSPHNSIYD